MEWNKINGNTEHRGHEAMFTNLETGFLSLGFRFVAFKFPYFEQIMKLNPSVLVYSSDKQG